MVELFGDIEDEIGDASPTGVAVYSFLRARDLELDVRRVEIVKVIGSLPRYSLKVVCDGVDLRFSSSEMDGLDDRYEFLHCIASVCKSSETGMVISKGDTDGYKTMISRGHEKERTTVVFNEGNYVLDENTTWYILSFCNGVSDVWTAVRNFIDNTDNNIPYHLVHEKPKGGEIERTVVNR